MMQEGTYRMTYINLMSYTNVTLSELIKASDLPAAIEIGKETAKQHGYILKAVEQVG